MNDISNAQAQKIVDEAAEELRKEDTKEAMEKIKRIMRSLRSAKRVVRNLEKELEDAQITLSEDLEP